MLLLSPPQGMHPELFSVFYRFVFFLCREPGKRNVQVWCREVTGLGAGGGVAVAARTMQARI
jgi:hypothetical protein